MPKLPCTHRAEWQLTPGKPAKRLSPHYQLGCDYGTPVITIYKESDGVEPIYLCENHAAEVGRSSANRAALRPIVAQPVTPGVQAKAEDRVEPAAEERVIPAEARDAKPTRAAPSEKAAGPALAAPERPAMSERPATDSVGRPPVRDLTSVNSFGNFAKALVDETIWNLAPGDYDVYRTALQDGKSRPDAAQAAGGQLAIVYRKIGEYTIKLGALLSESSAKISALECVNKPLEQAMLEIIATSAMDDAEKDAAIGQLGVLQESLNRGLAQEITVLQAQKIAWAIAERVNWGVSADLPDELKPAYWAVYRNSRDAIVAAVPEAANVFERLANLHVAAAELESAPQAKLPHHSGNAECHPLHS